jgi:D-glucosaminate-6-phosphate ammonia-lyase
LPQLKIHQSEVTPIFGDGTREEHLFATRGQDPDQCPGAVTVVRGSLMPPEVVQAMAEAAGWFVSIPELQTMVGTRIAGLLGVPATMVTAGAASAIAVGTAACMTRDNLPAIERLPETDGLRNEVILQKGHKSRY